LQSSWAAYYTWESDEMRALLSWLVAGALFAATPASGTECAPISGALPALAHIDAAERLAFLRARLERGARNARIWSWTWGVVYSGIAATSWTLAGVSDAHDRVDWIVNGAGATVGVAVLVISPLSIMRDQAWLERRLARAGPDYHVCAALADAERLLIRDADSQAFGKGPLVHVGNIVFNIGLGLILGAGFGHWDSAAQAWFVGAAVGELQIVTQPVDAIADLRRYRFGLLKPARDPWPWRMSVVPTFSRQQTGLSLAFQF
jgi:hypothetical protein